MEPATMFITTPRYSTEKPSYARICFIASNIPLYCGIGLLTAKLLAIIMSELIIKYLRNAALHFQGDGTHIKLSSQQSQQ